MREVARAPTEAAATPSETKTNPSETKTNPSDARTKPSDARTKPPTSDLLAGEPDGGVRYDGPRHQGPANTSPYPVSRLAPAIDLVNVAREIQAADAVLGVKMTAELELIAEQIRALQARAQEALAEAERSARLHRATCSFKKRPGHVYHLYRRSSPGLPDGAENKAGALYFSMLSPVEWGGRCPDTYEASYRLEVDMSFTRVDRASNDPSRGARG